MLKQMVWSWNGESGELAMALVEAEVLQMMPRTPIPESAQTIGEDCQEICC